MPSAADSARRRARADAVSAAALDSPQHTAPELRRAAADDTGVPAELAAYVAKVHAGAYKVIDEDFIAMRAAGHTDDELFEITIAAAVGAGMARLRAGFAAIDEAKD